jgi:hypothetical protein
MKKTKKLRKATIKIGNQIITYTIDPSLDLSSNDDSPFWKEKLEHADKSLRNPAVTLPPGLERKWRGKPIE